MATTRLAKIEQSQDVEILNQFLALPKLHSGRQLRISFKHLSGFKRFQNPAILAALDLEIGATICEMLRVLPQSEHLWVFAERALAQEVLSIPKGAQVDARVRTLYGVAEYPHHTTEGARIERNEATGLLIVEFSNLPPAVIH
jgi:hypothetical protein